MCSMKDIFESAVQSSGAQGGVFEFDGNTGYFYLYYLNGAEGEKVRGAVRVLTGGAHRLREGDVSIRWDRSDHVVALFIKEELCAAFDAQSGMAFGGETAEQRAAIPQSVRLLFQSL